MALKTSLLITGDSSAAQKAVQDLDRSVQNMAAGNRTAAASAAELTTVEGALAAATRATASANDEAAGAQRAAAAATDAGAAAATRAAAAQRAAAAATRENDAAAQRHAMGVRNLGQQFGDLAVMIQGGIDPARAFATQAGQMGYAMSEMQGKAGAVGAFLVGPWGIALTVATAALAPLVQELLSAEDALEKVELGADATGAAQQVLGGMFDLATGRIKSNTEALILNARAQAINMRAEAARLGRSSRETLAAAGAPSTVSSVLGYGALLSGQTVAGSSLLVGNNQVRALGRQARDANALTDERARAAALDRVLQRSEGVDFAGSGVDKRAFQQAIVDAATSRASAAVADLIDQSLDDGKLAEGLRKSERTKKPPRPKKPPSTAARDEFGRHAGDKIASIVAQFDGTPPVLRQVNSQVAQLDDLIEDLGRRKPLNFQTLIADAKTAKTVVEAGINRPYNDFIEAQQEQLDVLRLLAAGREDEAEALRTIQRLEAQVGTLTPERRDAVLATVQALRAEGREIELNRRRLVPYLDAIESVAATVDQATQAFARGDLGAIIRSPGKLLDAFQTLKGRQLFDQVFGDLFEQLKDEVSGTRIVEDASERMAGAVDQVAASTRATSGALGQLEAAARGAAGAVAGGAGGSAAFGGVGVSGAGAFGAIGLAIARGEIPTGPDIVVEGKRRLDPGATFTRTLEGVGSKIAGLFTNPESAEKIGKSIGKYAGRGLEGAATGAFVASAAGALGIKLDRGGSSIGGAIGGLTGLPGGGIVGGLLGGLVGSIFAPKARPGGATVSNVGGEAGYAGAVGSDKAAIAAGKDLAGSVAGSINQIVQQLGGTLGQFSVQIGSYKDDLRVNVNGRPLGGVKGSGATGFGDDANAAVNFAVAQALAQGAVTGVSDAVARALRSSTNVEAALKEALKVQEVETLIGGIGGQIERAFRDFEATAKERVRVAAAYGFDVVAIEKRNAADRAKIAEDLLRGQVGSLQSLVDEMTRGSLFEGSALDKVAKLNEAIAKSKADLDAGVDGAGDTLAGLYEQLNTALKASYGTTGGYAAGRDQIIDDARAAIAKANAQITAAQAKVSDPALTTTNRALDTANTALDENNDQNAAIIAELRALRGDFARLGSGTPSFDLRELARV